MGAIWLYDEIRPKVAMDMSRFLNEFAEEPIFHADIHNNHATRNIVVEIMSEGGCVKSALSIYDMLKYISKTLEKHFAKPQVITVGTGLVASAATIIFAAGSKRLAYKHTTFLFHQPELLGLFGVNERINREGEYLKAIENQMNAIYKSVIKKKGVNIENLIKSKSDLIISADEALEWGFVTEIL
jgi:ATP-dependent protease ClpP protease subunit